MYFSYDIILNFTRLLIGKKAYCDMYSVCQIFKCRFMDPITHGDYPNTMRSLVGDRLPKFSYEESQMLNGSFDFVGINYYTASYAANAPLLRNADPNYSTDSLVNLTGNLTSIFYSTINH